MIGYPAVAFLLGLLLTARSPLRPGTLVPLLLLAGGTAVIYPADATLLFVGAIGGGFVVASVALCREALIRRARCLPWQHVAVLALIAVVALVAKGSVARRWEPGAAHGAPLHVTVAALIDPAMPFGMALRPWEEVRPTLLDLEQAHAPIRMLGRDLLNGAIVLARGIWLALVVIAALRR